MFVNKINSFVNHKTFKGYEYKVDNIGRKVMQFNYPYDYENEISIEHFYICEWLAGEVGDGAGEEYQADRNRGACVR